MHSLHCWQEQESGTELFSQPAASKAVPRVQKAVSIVEDGAAAEEMTLVLEEFTRGFIRHTFKNLSQTICFISWELRSTQPHAVEVQGSGGESHPGDTGICFGSETAQDFGQAEGKGEDLPGEGKKGWRME